MLLMPDAKIIEIHEVIERQKLGPFQIMLGALLLLAMFVAWVRSAGAGLCRARHHQGLGHPAQLDGPCLRRGQSRPDVGPCC